jgi:hypothetical protein
MAPDGIVEPVDVAADGLVGFLTGVEDGPPDELGFQLRRRTGSTATLRGARPGRWYCLDRIIRSVNVVPGCLSSQSEPKIICAASQDDPEGPQNRGAQNLRPSYHAAGQSAASAREGGPKAQWPLMSETARLHRGGDPLPLPCSPPAECASAAIVGEADQSIGCDKLALRTRLDESCGPPTSWSPEPRVEAGAVTRLTQLRKRIPAHFFASGPVTQCKLRSSAPSLSRERASAKLRA